MNTEQISDIILSNISNKKEQLEKAYNSSKDSIGYFFIDDVLTEDMAMQCYEVFPDTSEMRRLKSIREFKYVSAQMDKHNELLER